MNRFYFLTATIACALLVGAAPGADESPQAIRADLLTVLGGNWGPDHLGPEAHEKLKAKLLANPQPYLLQLEQDFAHDNFNPASFSSLYVPDLLDLLGKVAPDTCRRLGIYFSKQLDTALLIYDLADDKTKLLATLSEENRDTVSRLTERRKKLAVALKQLDQLQNK